MMKSAGKRRKKNGIREKQTAAAVLVFLLFSLIVDKIIVKPVKDLTLGAMELGRGNYEINFSENQKDEIGALKKTGTTFSS